MPSICVLALLATGVPSGGDFGGTHGPADHPAMNLIRNGDFRNGLQDWGTIGAGANSYHPEDPGRAVFRVADRSLVVDIRNPGQSPWSVMFFQSVGFEKGATYAVSFKARSELPIRLVANVTKDRTWTNCSGDHVFSLTNSLSTYSYEFTMPESGSALVQFCLGNTEAGRAWFKDIVLTKKESGPSR